MVYEKNINVDEQVVVIKITARCTKADQYLAALIYINKYQHKLIDVSLHISDNSDFLTNASVKKSWVEIQRAIRDGNKNYSEKTENMATILLQNIMSILNIENIDILLLSAVYFNKMSVIKLIDNAVRKSIDDPNPMFDIDFENCLVKDIDIEKEEYENVEVSSEDIVKDESANEENKENKSEDKEKNEELQYSMIESSFIVSPVSGVLVSSVLIGDKIMVKISNKTTAEKDVLFAVRGQVTNDGMFMVPAEVIQNYISKKTNRPVLIVKLMDGIYSKIENFEPVKILMYKDYIDNVKHKPSASKWMFNILIFLSLWTVALAILALLFFR